MATYKIMLVEDDSNLLNIYADRLLAEGYDIVSARDGEEGLAVAVKEKPDLIISDVMMPKISGFDMVDILRTTPETKDVKIIMMTALSQAEDKARADKLGANKYLVKSQVTLEDVARVVHEVLEDQPAPTTTQPVVAEVTAPVAVAAEPAVAQASTTPVPAPAPMPEPAMASQPLAAPVTPAPALVPDPVVAAAPVANPISASPPVQTSPMPNPMQDTSAAAQPVFSAPQPDPSQNMPAAQAMASPPVNDPSAANDPAAPEMPDSSGGVKRVIQPLNNVDPNATPKIYELYEKEMASQAAIADSTMPNGMPNPMQQQVPQAAPQAQPQLQPQPQALQQPPAQPFDPNSVAL